MLLLFHLNFFKFNLFYHLLIDIIGYQILRCFNFFFWSLLILFYLLILAVIIVSHFHFYFLALNTTHTLWFWCIRLSRLFDFIERYWSLWIWFYNRFILWSKVLWSTFRFIILIINFFYLMNSLIDSIILFVENIWNSILNSTCIQLFFLIIILVEVSSHIYCFIMQERLI